MRNLTLTVQGSTIPSSKFIFTVATTALIPVIETKLQHKKDYANRVLLNAII